MVRGTMILVALGLALCIWADTGVSAERLTVQSKVVGTGEVFTVGIYLENDVDVKTLTLPLEIRSTSGGAYPTAISGEYSDDGRLPLGGPISAFTFLNSLEIEDGNCKQGQPGGFGVVTETRLDVAPENAVNVPNPDSPDMILFFRNQLFTDPLLSGTDFPIGTGTPSMSFTMAAPSVVGSFTIDTNCYDPAGHINFISTAGLSYIPEFTKGTITVLDCDCPWQADYVELGFRNSIDFGHMLEVLFFNGDDPQDPNCPTTRSDFNGDGFADSVDLNQMIQHLYFNGPPPCDPCNPIGATCQ